MRIEYEATFIDVDKNEMRSKLKEIGGELVRPEFTQKRSVFNLPAGNAIKGGWMRVRDEGDKITMSLKVVDGDNIEDQKESCLEVDSYEEAELFLEIIGCERKAYQETMRELWLVDRVEVTIDTWPFLEPMVEVESDSEDVVKKVSEQLGFDWAEARFCSVDVIYSETYGVPRDRINNHTPKIVFDMKNPFVE